MSHEAIKSGKEHTNKKREPIMKTLREYLEELNQLASDNPAALDMPVITSKDDEGNGYRNVHYSPSVGEYDGDDYCAESDVENAVCLN